MAYPAASEEPSSVGRGGESANLVRGDLPLGQTNQLRVTAQLIDATTDTHLWAEPRALSTPITYFYEGIGEGGPR